MPQQKPNLYALLVGINRYRYPVSSLDGCVRDAKRMRKYLKKEEKKGDFVVHTELLKNKKATKAQIVEQFQAHLGKAGPGDVALFYFSGHGAQEWVDTGIWRFEPDEKLEGLVCYDSINKEGNGTLLADKELRYLINQVATRRPDGQAKENAPHILTIFDCCHSGENTRNIGIGQAHEGARERRYIPMRPEQEGQARLEQIQETRDWSEFIFADQDGITTEVLKTEDLGTVLPQSKHIQLSACRSDESSYEFNGSGIFTKNLLEVLERSQGAVSYYDLRGRLKNYIKNQFRQTPQIYEAGGSEEIYRSFLNKKEVGKPLYGSITYNKTEGWTMDLGAIHGISKQAEKIKVVSPEGDEQFEAGLGKIEASRTFVAFKEADLEQLDTKKAYWGSVEGYLSAPIHIFINNLDQEEEAENQLKNLLEKEGKNLFYTPDEAGADYTVQMGFGHYYITEPENPYRPLVTPTDDYSEDAAHFTHSYLRHISQWEYVKRLDNDGDNQLPRDAIKVEVFKVKKDEQGREQLELLPFTGEDEVLAGLDKTGPDEYGSTLRIKITNMSTHKLWMSFVYLYRNFEIDPEWFANVVQVLEPREGEGKEGGSVWVLEDEPDIIFELEKSTRIYNWKEDVSFFKIIASRQEFDVRQLQQGSLPDPAELADRKRGEGVAKGPRKKRKEENAGADDWMTRLFTVRLPNPHYNRISQKELSELLETEAAEFIYNLYLEQDAPFGGEFKLKEGIVWKDEALEKGLFFELKLMAANWISRQIRHRRYRRMIKAEPDRMRLVSEGDSWFQHPDPKVLDIIDQLFKKYAIYSLGAGGDRLREYFADKEYKKALVTEQPKIFLLSGGGNDILGKQIKKFLVEEIETGADPQSFLNEDFFREIKDLGDIYRQVFEEVRDDFPGMQILCHGYDYILPDPEKGWFGKYAGSKIKEKGDLKKLADFLIDHFNERLAAVAEPYDHVHFIDLRGVVGTKKDLWHDEIHPNSNGFGIAAKKFTEKIHQI